MCSSTVSRPRALLQGTDLLGYHLHGTDLRDALNSFCVSWRSVGDLSWSERLEAGPGDAQDKAK